MEEVKSVRTRLFTLPDQIEIQALVHKEEGSFWAEVPSCPGLFASGDSLDELVEALSEAWALYHDDGPVDAAAGSNGSTWLGAASSLTLRVPAFT
jgi:predicted RNase H-like HicB family nuclease